LGARVDKEKEILAERVILEGGDKGGVFRDKSLDVGELKVEKASVGAGDELFLKEKEIFDVVVFGGEENEVQVFEDEEPEDGEAEEEDLKQEDPLIDGDAFELFEALGGANFGGVGFELGKMDFGARVDVLGKFFVGLDLLEGVGKIAVE